MTAVETYTKSGAKATTPAKLDKDIFGLRVENHQLLKDAYLAYLANGRANYAKTKTRGVVRGGGAKPWRQKGTGRARVGSSRNPVWTGGGVAFGPLGVENYSRKLNIKAKRQALRQALSLAATENRLKIIDSLEFADGKVKSAVKLLGKIKAGGRILLITEEKNESVNRATRNLPDVRLIKANYLTVFDILNANTVVISKKALESINAHLGVKK